MRMRTRNDSPCVPGCPERSPTCHSTCKRYSNFVDGNKRRREDNRKNNAWTQSKVDATVRISKYNQKKGRGVI